VAGDWALASGGIQWVLMRHRTRRGRLADIAG